MIKKLVKSDIPLLVDAFAKANWPKPASIFENYLNEQNSGERIIWVAKINHAIAGYITLKWHSDYPPFSDVKIPEIKDLNVLPSYRRQGIASALLDIAENVAATRNNTIGLGVGLYRDYGAAQRLYIKRGYVPDGQGITYREKPVEPGNQVCLDDDLILWLTTNIKQTQ